MPTHTHTKWTVPRDPSLTTNSLTPENLDLFSRAWRSASWSSPTSTPHPPIVPLALPVTVLLGFHLSFCRYANSVSITCYLNFPSGPIKVYWISRQLWDVERNCCDGETRTKHSLRISAEIIHFRWFLLVNQMFSSKTPDDSMSGSFVFMDTILT